MKKYMLMLVFMASILWGCGNSLKEGEIYEKTFTPEHYENVIVPQAFVFAEHKGQVVYGEVKKGRVV